MARSDQQFPLRLPPELKEKLENAAKESGRSKNAEAVYRLEESFKSSMNENDVFEKMNNLLTRLEKLEQQHKED